MNEDSWSSAGTSRTTTAAKQAHLSATGVPTGYLHNSAILAAIEGEKLIGFPAVRRDGRRTGTSSQPGLHPVGDLGLLHLFTTQGVGERGLQQRQVPSQQQLLASAARNTGLTGAF